MDIGHVASISQKRYGLDLDLFGIRTLQSSERLTHKGRKFCRLEPMLNQDPSWNPRRNRHGSAFHNEQSALRPSEATHEATHEVTHKAFLICRVVRHS